jgi:uncharacterized protein YndB with AHSA1/START domain
MVVRATKVIHADADTVFQLITDPHRLHTWNRIVQRTIEAPVEITPGAQWIIEMHALGQTWHSISTAVSIDPKVRQFMHRSATDDGNPSYADWTWTVTPDAEGCVVEVSAALHPATFWRRVLLAKIRARQLGRELPESLDRLAEAVVSSAVS